MGGRAVLSLAGLAVALGLIGAVSGLLFLWVIEFGPRWYGDVGTGWFDGPPWWVAVAAGAGLLVGILRKAFGMPAETPGLIEDLQNEEVEARWVPSMVAVSFVSLIGGASLGPEVALGQMGGGAGALIAKRRTLDEDNTKSLTLSGMAGAFGGLFSSPLLAIILVTEIAQPARRRYLRTFYGSLIASSVSLGIYFAIAGSVFLGVYQVPEFEFADWHLLAGLGLGLAAAVVVLLTVLITRAAAKILGRMGPAGLVKPLIAGITFGLIGVALPLTNFTGSDQLEVVLQEGATLGIGLLVAILVGKIIAFSVSAAGGFIGGPIFPILFLGGTAGVIVNQVIPEIPLGLAFTCLLAAVPGSIVPAPFTMVLLTALLAQIGALETTPVLIAVGTAYLIATTVRRATERRQQTAWEKAPYDSSAIAPSE
jgi:H+/Cl- antiporter ClcA